jgi:lactoylglutathione lyase
MISHVPVRRLFESHLTASDLQCSVNFYRDLVGLTLALEVPERNVAFFWVGEAEDSLLGLWSLGSSPLGITLHVAFEATIDDLLGAPKRLESQGYGNHRAERDRLDAGCCPLLP